MKECWKCKIEKNESEFAKSSSRKDGLQSRCKQCSKEYNFQLRSKNREAYNAQYRKRYADNREERHKSQHKYYLKIKDERRSKHAQDPRKELLMHAKMRAKKKNLSFNLEIEDIIIPDKCPVFGIDLFVTKGIRSDNSPTIDRLLPELGYVKDNIYVISYRANRIKNDGTLEEHQKICEYIKERINATTKS